MEGHSARLDEARGDASWAQEAIDGLQARHAAETGIKGLRIEVNMLVGCHVEVPSSQARAPGDGFVLRQGVASSMLPLR